MNNKTIFKLSYLFYGLVLLTALLIILKVIPYTWVNGGRSASYNAQVQVSMANIVIAFLGFLYVLTNQRAKKLQANKLFRGFKWALVPFWGLSLVLQFLGTPFEIFLMSPVVLLGLYTHFNLAKIKSV